MEFRTACPSEPAELPVWRCLDHPKYPSRTMARCRSARTDYVLIISRLFCGAIFVEQRLSRPIHDGKAVFPAYGLKRRPSRSNLAVKGRFTMNCQSIPAPGGFVCAFPLSLDQPVR